MHYETGTHRGEGIAGVRYQHAGFTDGAVTDRDTLYEPGSAHFHQRSPGSPPRTRQTSMMSGPLSRVSVLSFFLLQKRDHHQDSICFEEKPNPQRFRIHVMEIEIEIQGVAFKP